MEFCSDGTLVAWGLGLGATLGNGSTASSRVPVLVNSTGVLAGKSVVSVAAYASCSVALCADGSLATWGSNGYGELGSGSTAFNSSVPVTVSMQPLGSGERFLFLGTGQGCSHVLTAATSSFSNTKLTGLTIGGVTLSPAFSPTVNVYTGTLNASSQSVTVRPAPAGSWVGVVVNGIPVAPGAASAPIPLALGLNTLTVSVTAQDRSVGTYLVSVNNVPYETWKNLSFPNVADRTNPQVSGWSASPAGDGISNLTKYGLGLNPFTQSHSSMPTVLSEGEFLAFTFRRNKLASDLTFVAEACDDPSQKWTELHTVPVIEDMGDYWLVKVRDSELKGNHPKRFMRLRIGAP